VTVGLSVNVIPSINTVTSIDNSVVFILTSGTVGGRVTGKTFPWTSSTGGSFNIVSGGTWTLWWVNSVGFTSDTVGGVFFTGHTLWFTKDDLGGTDWDVFDSSGFDFLWWDMTFWWVDSSISTDNTVRWRLGTDVTLFLTWWTFGDTVVIVVIFTFTKGTINSGFVGTGRTSVISGTGGTSIVTSFTIRGIGIEELSGFTNTSTINHDSSLSTSDTVIWGTLTSSTFVSTRWTSGSVGIISTFWATTSRSVNSVSGTNGTFRGDTVLTGRTLDGTRYTSWAVT